MRYLLSIILFAPILASAQTKAAKRSCRLVFLNPAADAPKKLFLFDGVSSQLVALPSMNFSDVYQIAPGDTSVALTPTAVSKPEEIPPGTPIKKLPPDITDFYLIVASDPANKVSQVQFQVVDAGSQKFKKGQMMWFNLTANSVGGQIGSQKLALKGQSRAIVEAPALRDEAFDVKIGYAIANEPRIYPICQTKWVHDSRSRIVMFVHGGEDNSTPQIEGFTDFRDAPDPTNKEP